MSGAKERWISNWTGIEYGSKCAMFFMELRDVETGNICVSEESRNEYSVDQYFSNRCTEMQFGFLQASATNMKEKDYQMT